MLEIAGIPGAPIALALVAALCIGTSDFIYRAAGGGHDPVRWMRTQSVAFAAVVLPLAIALDTTFGPGALYGLVNGPINLLAFYCVLRALSRGDALALSPIARLNFVVTAILTVIVLDEALTVSRLVGLALAVAAVMLVGGHYARLGGDRMALGFALIAMLASGIAGLLFKLGLGAGATPIELVAAQATGFVVCAVAAAAARANSPRRSAPAPQARRFAAICGVLIAGFYIALTVAFTAADAVVVAPIAQLGFVLTSALAVLRLGERFSPARGAALALAIGAVASLALG